MATTPVVPEVKKSQWRVLECGQAVLAETLNGLHADGYHVHKLFQNTYHDAPIYTVIARLAPPFNYDIPKIRKNSGEILAVIEKEVARQKAARQ